MAAPRATVLSDLLARLFEDGRAEVAATLGPAPDSDEALDAALLALDARARRDAPGRAPPLDLSAARWAARSLYAACQGLALRGAPAADVAAALAAPAPDTSLAPSPAVAWSVDLAFVVLPDLTRLTRGLAAADPVRAALSAWARRWPLSSVGAALDGPVAPDALSPVLADEALLGLYVDRLLARADVARLAEPRVADAARAALGLHAGLCPLVSEALVAGAPT